ncbi:uncharacterized protein LOC136035248 [Artemia franciscana]
MKGKHFVVLFAVFACVLAHVAELRSAARIEKENDPDLLNEELAPSSGKYGCSWCAGVCCFNRFCCGISCTCRSNPDGCNCPTWPKQLIQMVSDQNGLSSKNSQVLVEPESPFKIEELSKPN